MGNPALSGDQQSENDSLILHKRTKAHAPACKPGGMGMNLADKIAACWPKATIHSRPERVDGHIGTETLGPDSTGGAVGNIKK